MLIKDPVYGAVEVNDTVLIELINSEPFQRLKGIKNGGVLYKVIPWKVFTRHEHSVGVMLLLKRLGAPLEEQIAGLLHDISHTAFSHAVDFVFKRKEHDFHEDFHRKIVLESEVPSILKKNGFDVNRILDESNFPLLERKSPDLCADRVDYSLREWVARGDKKQKIKGYLDALTVFNKEIVFSDKKKAKEFSEEFLDMVASWASPLQLAVVELISDSLRIALEKGIISQSDLFGEDAEVYLKLENSDDRKILKNLSLLTPKLKVVEDDKKFDFESKEKVRYVDPHILISGKLTRVSEEFPVFNEKIKKHRALIEKEVRARIVGL